MRKNLLALAVVGLLATTAMTACEDSDSPSDTSGGAGTTGSGEARVGVILPDTKSSDRWVNADAKYLKQAFDSAGVKVEIKNAEGDKENFKRIGSAMVNSGVKVLIIANLDAESGKAVIDQAKAKKIPTIDYDRLTLNGGASYYVSFDGEAVGRQQADALKDCLAARRVVNPIVAELNGSPTDNNATLFKTGYDRVLQPMYDAALYTKGPDQFVPDWDNKEGTKIFAQMLEQQPGISAVLAANDGLGNAAIEVLRKKGLAGKVPVTGQDATVQGLQNVLSGEQCVTIFKDLKPLAKDAADLAVKLFKGQQPTTKDRLKDPESGAYVPFVARDPVPITIDSINKVVDAGFVNTQELCAGKYKQLCRQHGVGGNAAQ